MNFLENDDGGGVIPMDISEEDTPNSPKPFHRNYQINAFLTQPTQQFGEVVENNGENDVSIFSGVGTDPSEFVTCDDDEDVLVIQPPQVIQQRKFVYAKRGNRNNRRNNQPQKHVFEQPQFQGFGDQLKTGGSLLSQWANTN